MRAISADNLEYLGILVSDFEYAVLIGIVDDLNKAGTLRRIKTNLNRCCSGVKIGKLQGKEVTVAPYCRNIPGIKVM